MTEDGDQWDRLRHSGLVIQSPPLWLMFVVPFLGAGLGVVGGGLVVASAWWDQTVVPLVEALG